MKKQVSLLILSILLLSLLSSTHIQSAAESPHIPIQIYIQLHEAAYAGDLAGVQQALAQGANVNGEKIYKSPLLQATMQGRLNVITFLLKKGADANAKDCYGYTSLFYICNDIKFLPPETAKAIVTILLAHKADVNVTTKIDNETPLICVIQSSQTKDIDRDIVRQLILAGADVNIKSRSGQTASSLIESYAMYLTVENALKERDHMQPNAQPYYEANGHAQNAEAEAKEKKKKEREAKNRKAQEAKSARKAQKKAARDKAINAQEIWERVIREQVARNKEKARISAAEQLVNDLKSVDDANNFELNLIKMQITVDRTTYRKLFNAMSLRWHPDKVTERGGSLVEIQQAQQNFAKIRDLNERRPLSYFTQ